MTSLFQELKRRNVFRVAIAYVAVGWLILQVSDIVLDNIAAPDWLMKALMFFLLIGFPLAVLFAWAYEMTPEGIKKEKDVDRSQSITNQTGQKLNRTIIVVLLAAVGFLLVDKFMLGDSTPNSSITDPSVAVLPFGAMSNGPDDEYFAALAKLVTDGLDACGYVYCPGDVMASNPKWRQPLKKWKRYFHKWITVPEEKALMHANIFFDLRCIAGSSRLVDELIAPQKPGIPNAPGPMGLADADWTVDRLRACL